MAWLDARCSRLLDASCCVVDEKPSDIGELRSHLCVSPELFFRAQVLNRQDAIGKDIEGGDRVEAVVDTSPQLHRCERLMFDVMPNSSLPFIRNTFHGLSDEGDEERRDLFSFPHLTAITLTGSTFADTKENPNISHFSSLNYPNLLLSGLICIINEFVGISNSNALTYVMISKSFYRTIGSFK